MEKIEPQSLQADWSKFEDHAPWSLITSPELAEVLGVHLQTIANWRMRQILPPPEPANRKLRGNVIRYRISVIQAWLAGSGEEEVIWAWIRRKLPNDQISNIGQAKFLVQHCHEQLGLKKPYCNS